MHCRLCKSKSFFNFLDLGYHPPSDQFRKKNQIHFPVIYYPLQVQKCSDCHFFQLTHVVDPKILYQDDYPYESSTTDTGKLHYNDFAESVIKDFSIEKNSLVIDIGSNVGVLLEGFKKNGMKVVGVDPAKNIVDIANRREIFTLNSFFDMDISKKIYNEYGKAKVITGTNVFAHVDDLESFMLAVDNLIDHKKGVFIIEAPYVLNLFENMEYDTIYHEHLSYISVNPLIKFFKKFNMEIIDIHEKDIHGGSIRIFVSKINNYKVSNVIQEFIQKEKNYGLENNQVLIDFSHKVKKNKFDLISLLLDLKSKGNKIAAVSAPAKGMTLLNYCNINKDIIEFVTEKSKLKINSFTPGGQIPVYDDSALLTNDIDYALLLAWNFSEEIIKNNDEFIKKGGKFIIPIPSPIII
jgi:hypothetical protein